MFCLHDGNRLIFTATSVSVNQIDHFWVHCDDESSNNLKSLCVMLNKRVSALGFEHCQQEVWRVLPRFGWRTWEQSRSTLLHVGATFSCHVGLGGDFKRSFRAQVTGVQRLRGGLGVPSVPGPQWTCRRRPLWAWGMHFPQKPPQRP